MLEPPERLVENRRLRTEIAAVDVSSTGQLGDAFVQLLAAKPRARGYGAREQQRVSDGAMSNEQ